MKTSTITPTASHGSTATAGAFRISDTARTLAVFAVLFLIYATVDGIADLIFGGAL